MLNLTVFENGTERETIAVDRFPCLIGKHANNQIVLSGWTIGRVHAEIRATEQGFKLVDRGSLAGTWVNNERIVEFGPLSERDEIVIGSYRLRAQLPDDAAPTAPRAPAAAPAAAPRAEAAVRPAPAPSPAPAPAPVAAAPAATAVQDEQLAEYLATFNWRQQVHQLLLQTIDLRRRDIRSLSDEALRSETEALIREVIASKISLPADIDREQLIDDVLHEAVGLGPLEKLLADPSISEIMVNRSDEIFVERGGRLQRYPAAFTSEEAVRGVIERIVAPLGRRIDESSPMVDARLKDGSRVNAIIPPLALRGAALTIRKFSRKRLEVEDLIGFGSANQLMFDFLKVCVERHKNIIISGGTGSGKTTLLNVLSNLIPRGERIVTIEDAAELQLNHPHLVSLESRPTNLEGKGGISIRDLVRNSLRMRPDRIVVGECRGGEALDMLQAMNTGHDGSLTTAHANTPRDVVSRLEVMVLMAGMDIPVTAIREQIASAIDIIVQQTRAADGSRRITHIAEITGVEGGKIQMQDLFRFEQRGFDANGKVVGHFTGCDAVPSFYEDLRRVGVPVDLSIFDRVQP
ncbi:ATPase, T2SS/T4P/T4SS family [Chitinimonas koreensis]|uniref:ATPase, T2SS/T4P/T4SS family n=1 Tax=Chitinimonas koreensis TaxID=356302 RepID=UPI000427D7EA|nr:ATPase, T2SS/T4P/T4SS family [Chitinimonas koreensis]